jgi:hypothetical protein
MTWEQAQHSRAVRCSAEQCRAEQGHNKLAHSQPDTQASWAPQWWDPTTGTQQPRTAAGARARPRQSNRHRNTCGVATPGSAAPAPRPSKGAVLRRLRVTASASNGVGDASSAATLIPRPARTPSARPAAASCRPCLKTPRGRARQGKHTTRTPHSRPRPQNVGDGDRGGPPLPWARLDWVSGTCQHPVKTPPPPTKNRRRREEEEKKKRRRRREEEEEEEKRRSRRGRCGAGHVARCTLHAAPTGTAPPRRPEGLRCQWHRCGCR